MSNLRPAATPFDAIRREDERGTARRMRPLLLEDPRGLDGFSLPGKHEDSTYRGHVGYIYTVAMSSGLIKVGWTGNPQKRIREHRKNAEPHGVSIVGIWLSPEHMNFVANEAELINFGQRNGAKTIRHEYFEGLTFAKIVRFARGLAFHPVDDEEIRRRWEAETTPLSRALAASVATHAATPAPRDFSEAAHDAVRRLFGGLPDGTYRHPSTGARDEGDSHESLARIEATGMPAHQVLRLDWIGLLEELITAVVQTEAINLRLYAVENGLEHLLRPTGDALFEIGGGDS